MNAASVPPGDAPRELAELKRCLADWIKRLDDSTWLDPSRDVNEVIDEMRRALGEAVTEAPDTAPDAAPEEGT